MAEVLLVNPAAKRRRRKATTAKRRRTPAAAKRRTVAKRRTYRRNPVQHRAAAPKRRRSYRRNPIKLPLPRGVVKGQIEPAFQGALGAIFVDMAAANLPFIPQGLKVGPIRHVTKAGLAISLGLLAEFVIKKQTARNAAVGSLVVTTRDVIREAAARFAPNFSLGFYEDAASGMGYWNPGYVRGYRPETGALGFYYPEEQLQTPAQSQADCECPGDPMQNGMGYGF